MSLWPVYETCTIPFGVQRFRLQFKEPKKKRTKQTSGGEMTPTSNCVAASPTVHIKARACSVVAEMSKAIPCVTGRISVSLEEAKS